MIGLLFHGPEIFDSGWAQRIIATVGKIDSVRCVLAGAMGRTAVIDSGLQGFEFWEKMPGPCLRELGPSVASVIFANLGKSAKSGLVLGSMVVERSGVQVPVVQVECSGPFFVEWIEGSSPAIIAAIEGLDIPRQERIQLPPSVWERQGRVYRRMTTAEPGDFVLVDGINVGRATGEEVILVAENGHLVEVQGVEVKDHGIEKLDRFGGVDLRAAKLVSTPNLRRTNQTPRVSDARGRGVAFVDHAGMHVYELAPAVEGVVTVGDDTTAVVADIMYRFQVPVIGIVDGDEDVVLQNAHFAPGSVRLTVREDDHFGLDVLANVFAHAPRVDMGFAEVRDRIVELAGAELLDRQDF